jgi:hypothetical protein
VDKEQVIVIGGDHHGRRVLVPKGTIAIELCVRGMMPFQVSSSKSELFDSLEFSRYYIERDWVSPFKFKGGQQVNFPPTPIAVSHFWDSEKIIEFAIYGCVDGVKKSDYEICNDYVKPVRDSFYENKFTNTIRKKVSNEHAISFNEVVNDYLDLCGVVTYKKTNSNK